MGEVTNFTIEIENILNSNSTKHADKLLVGGDHTNPEEVPHNILFMNYLAVCGGVIISNKLVLTCAHCLDSNKNRPDMKVFAGARYIFDKKADVYDVWDFIVHKDYDHPIRYANDVALLIIRGEFEFKSSVQKAKLVNHRNWAHSGNVFKVSGWEEKMLHDKKTTTQGLLTADLRYVNHQECLEKMNAPLSPEMFCLDGDEGKGICRGDSGGAAIFDNYVVGLASHNMRCGELPGIYINVYYLRPWIEIHAQKLYYKYCLFHNGDLEYSGIVP
ncbi:trypsin domain-containing protein [Phthorimaea operculella]|nr:trypsin domain-containing protein [Phthorimaea operculella]